VVHICSALWYIFSLHLTVLEELLYPIKQFTHTITSNNGKEFTLHENISKSLNTKFYFCDPYSAWQRGLNKNTNGLVRRYIPKKRALKI
jgi:IS30 family transposase